MIAKNRNVPGGKEFWDHVEEVAKQPVPSVVAAGSPSGTSAREFWNKWHLDNPNLPGESLMDRMEKFAEAYAASVSASLREQLEHEKKRVCIGGDVFEAGRNQLILHQQTELDYLLRAEAAEKRVAEVQVALERQATVEIVWGRCTICKCLSAIFSDSELCRLCELERALAGDAAPPEKGKQ